MKFPCSGRFITQRKNVDLVHWFNSIFSLINLNLLLASLFPEGTERSLCSRCVCRGGKVSVRPFVRPSVRSDFTPFQLEYLHETFRIYIWYGQDYAQEIFSRQGAPFFFDAPKRGFSVKRIEVLQFLSQNVQIFRMCSSNHGQKNVGNRFLIQGPQIFLGGGQKLSKF